MSQILLPLDPEGGGFGSLIKWSESFFFLQCWKNKTKRLIDYNNKLNTRCFMNIWLPQPTPMCM